MTGTDNLASDIPADTEVNQSHPWLGLSSFSEETRQYFYGREEEVSELARRVQRKLLTILFGQSGLGKTSILRAGIVPRLRAQGYCPVYVRIDYGPDAPSAQQQIKQAILQETVAFGTWTRSGIAVADESLWEFLHHRDDVLLDAQGKPLMPLLIFDQFEEIFTLAQSDDDGRRRASDFLEGLAELVENRPSRALEARLEEDDSAVERFDFSRNDYRVLITLREDYLAHLESLKTAMPSITQNRLRLAPMTGTQALAAVTGPGGKLVTEEVAEAIVRFVAGGAELAHAQVEPSLLSLICRELNDKRIASRRAEISLDLLAGSHASILTDFYERALGDQPQAVRNVIEDVLLTESGYRENVAEERVLKHLAAAGAVPDAQTVLALLVNRRLLRIEDRLDIRRVELTHDVLCNVVKASRGLRHEREERSSTERKLVAQRERELSTRKSLVRARQIIAVCLVLTVAAVASSVFGYISMRRAQETRALADSSRDGAEKLVGYLLDDFYSELQPIGRLDMVGGLASRTVSYYQNLPEAMRSSATDANYARALLRLGQVSRSEGKLVDAARILDQSIALLEPVVASNKANEANNLSLSDALQNRGLIAYSNGEFAVANTMVERAVAIAAPFATAPMATLAARLAYAHGRTRAGYFKLRNMKMASAQIELNAARAAVADVAERNANIPAMIAYLTAGQWLHETLARGEIKDYAGAEKLAQELIADAQEVLKKRPGDKDALRIKGAVTFMQGYYALHQKLTVKALNIFTDGVHQTQELLLSDPENQIEIGDLAIYLGMQVSALVQLGRPSEARVESDRIWALYQRAAPSAYQAGNLYNYALTMATVHAERGDVRQLVEMKHRLEEYSSQQLQGQAVQRSQALALTAEINNLYLADILDESSVNQRGLADVIRRGEQLMAQSKDTLTRAFVYSALPNVHRIQAHIAYAQGDYKLAELSSRQALGLLLQADSTAIDAPIYRMEHALALARLKRLPEASVLINEALKVQLRQIADGADDQTLRLQLAQSLYVSALTQPKAGSRELSEAASLIAKLPVEIQNYRSVNLWRKRINDEIRLNTRAALAAS